MNANTRTALRLFAHGFLMSPSHVPSLVAGGWTFLTNHAHVLLCLASDPDARLRDVADRVGITQRAVQHILADLEAAGAITRERVGRRNRYAVHAGVSLRHPLEAAHTVGELLALGPPASLVAPARVLG